MAKKKRIKPSKYPERILKALVKEYYESGNESIRRDGMALSILAVRAGIVEDHKTQVQVSNTKVCSSYGDFVSETDAALREMEELGWVKKQGSAGDLYILPTAEGLRHGRWLLLSWYSKAFDAVKAEFRTIIVAVITAAIVSVVTTLIMQLLD